ncbi:MAG: hypothetical protein IJB36_02475 [Clostridia bacterium]|nr:hypothetical protein [Clostridia bacterium]
MRFYQECVNVAKSVGAVMDEQRRRQFAKTPVEEWYHPLGRWICRLLPTNSYLREALTVLGYRSDEEISRYLVEFSQNYWKLVYADML